MNRDVQRIMTSQAYRRVFPGITLNEKWARPARREARRTMGLFEIPGRRGFLRSAGVGKAIAGNAADGAIIDDPFGKPRGRRQPCRAAADLGLVRQRPVHAALGQGLDRADAHPLASRRPGRPAAAEDGRPRGRPLGDPLPAGRPRGRPRRSATTTIASRARPLWPQFKSAADLEIIRQQDAKAFAALYQQDPAEASQAEWAPELFGDWIWVPPEKWPPQFDLRVVCVDASKGKSDKQGDYCAIVFLGVGGDELLYVDAIVERIPLDQIVRKTVLFCDEKRPDLVGIEAEQFQELLVHEFRRQCGEQFALRWPLYQMATKGVAKSGADPAAEPVRDQSRVAFQGRFAWLPPAGRSAHGFPAGRARRRARRAGNVHAASIGGIMTQEESGASCAGWDIFGKNNRMAARR